jgi:hypothetical protein
VIRANHHESCGVCHQSICGCPRKALVLPCLSLRQPWAWLVLHGGKDIENRKWNTKLRGPFVIHASKHDTRCEWENASAFAQQAGFSAFVPRGVPRGGIIGFARIKHVYSPGKPVSPWHMPDQYGFALADVMPLPFRHYAGALGFFKVELTAGEELLLRTAGMVLT